jgi:DNA-directed RNA polymerase subunit F
MIPKKEKREKLTGRDYAALLKKLEKRTQYLQKLGEKDPEKAKGLQEKIAWDTMMKRAAGQKVKVSHIWIAF